MIWSFLNSPDHLGELVKHALGDPSEPHRPKFFALLTSLPKDTEEFTLLWVDSHWALSQLQVGRDSGFSEYDLSPPFLLLLGMVLKGMQDKFSVGKETILTRGCDTQDPQVPQLLPKLLPTEWSEYSGL